MKVVNRTDSGESGICQKPELVSNFVKTVSPANCASICSTAGSGYLSLQTLWLNFAKSTHHHNHSITPLSWLLDLGNDFKLFHTYIWALVSLLPWVELLYSEEH